FALFCPTPSFPPPQCIADTAPNAISHAPPAIATSAPTTLVRARCASLSASNHPESSAATMPGCTSAACGTFPRASPAPSRCTVAASPTNSGPCPESSDSLRCKSASGGIHIPILHPSNAREFHSASISLQRDALAAPPPDACAQFRPAFPPSLPERPAAPAPLPTRTISPGKPPDQKCVALLVV